MNVETEKLPEPLAPVEVPFNTEGAEVVFTQGPDEVGDEAEVI